MQAFNIAHFDENGITILESGLQQHTKFFHPDAKNYSHAQLYWKK
jgi:hypothetical protein